MLIGIARKFASCGYAVFAMDLPGLGLSEGLHCYIPSFDALVDDVVEHYSKVLGMNFGLNLKTHMLHMTEQDKTGYDMIGLVCTRLDITRQTF